MGEGYRTSILPQEAFLLEETNSLCMSTMRSNCSSYRRAKYIPFGGTNSTVSNCIYETPTLRVNVIKASNLTDQGYDIPGHRILEFTRAPSGTTCIPTPAELPSIRLNLGHLQIPQISTMISSHVTPICRFSDFLTAPDQSRKSNISVSRQGLPSGTSSTCETVASEGEAHNPFLNTEMRAVATARVHQ